MKAIITGATGMVGGIVLQQCLQSSEIEEVVSISRRSCGVQHSKLTEIIHKDFTDYNSIASSFDNVNVAYYCIGAYTGAVSDDIFKNITYDFTVAFAQQLKKSSPNAKFCFLSGSGADPKEKSRVAFARYKGMAENDLIKKEFGGLSIFRPGYIYPVEPRQEPNLMYRVSRTLYPLIKLFGKNASITSVQLAQAMFKAGIQGTNQTILENRDIIDFLDAF